MMNNEQVKERNLSPENGSSQTGRYGYTKPDDYPSCMYDEETGLPSFNLFEDRLMMALINERAKNRRMRKQNIAVIGVAIENFADFSVPSVRAAVMRKTAERLTGILPPNHTVARGINYPFWIMIPSLSTGKEAETWVDKIREALRQEVSVRGQVYGLQCRFGVSLFEHDPQDTVTTLVGKAIASLQKAAAGHCDVVYFFELAKG